MAIFDRRWLRCWQWLVAAALPAGAVGYLLNETQPYIEGANDNATAVAVLMGTGDLCYVTRHGIGHVTEYTLHPEPAQRAIDRLTQSPTGPLGRRRRRSSSLGSPVPRRHRPR